MAAPHWGVEETFHDETAGSRLVLGYRFRSVLTKGIGRALTPGTIRTQVLTPRCCGRFQALAQPSQRVLTPGVLFQRLFTPHKLRRKTPPLGKLGRRVRSCEGLADNDSSLILETLTQSFKGLRCPIGVGESNDAAALRGS